MKRINSLVQKLASIAPKAASLAIVVAGVFATSPMAFAQCSFLWGDGYAPGTPIYESAGGFGDQGLLYVNASYSGVQANVEYQQSGDFTIQSLSVASVYPGTVWPTKGTITLYSNQGVGFSGTVPSTATNGQSAQVTMTVSGILLGGISTQCSQTVTVVVTGNPCGQKVTEWNGKLLTPTLDSATGYCKIEPVPTGAAGPFIYNNSYYVVANKTTTCLPGAGTLDGTTNCLYMAQPPGGTLWQNSFFVPVAKSFVDAFGYSFPFCSLGTYDASTNNCLVESAPWGTQAFQYTNQYGQVMWYFTPLMTCPVAGAWDGAHCYIMTAPTGTTASLASNTFYYH